MSTTPTKTYSPFWPILILLLGFISVQTVYLKSAWSQREQLKTSATEMKAVVSQAATVEKTLESVGRDLNDLAGKNAEAAKIVQEFQIRIQPSSTAAK
jgi:hypothetical protein